MPFTRLVILVAHLAQAALGCLHHRRVLAAQVGLAGLEQLVVVVQALAMM
jgi:hypothetical protein